MASVSCRISRGVSPISPQRLNSSPRPNFSGRILPTRSYWNVPALVVRASAAIDSYGSSSDFAKRIEQAWLIAQQPRPVACSSCESNGYVECKWCGGTGFFIIGNNMLCEVPSRNTHCIICAGKGSECCPDCKGTGFRAKWLGRPSAPS